MTKQSPEKVYYLNQQPAQVAHSRAGTGISKAWEMTFNWKDAGKAPVKTTRGAAWLLNPSILELATIKCLGV